ncbi:uncharacterized protein LOC134839080 [Symsagittifera roscoffensis]|uniref:uncharacterized protein LOC134839080 n=1 Tax=Symsagittifera roscoffensis TaxID=84072 RepID=UPI00307C2678
MFLKPALSAALVLVALVYSQNNPDDPLACPEPPTLPKTLEVVSYLGDDEVIISFSDEAYEGSLRYESLDVTVRLLIAETNWPIEEVIYSSSEVLLNSTLTLNSRISNGFLNQGAVYQITVRVVGELCGEFVQMSREGLEHIILTRPPTINSDVSVMFMNDSILCVVWHNSKEEANYDRVTSTLSQWSGGETVTELDRVDSRVGQLQDTGFQCLDLSAINPKQLLLIRIRTEVNYYNFNPPMTSLSTTGQRNIEFRIHRFGVEVDTYICDGDSCLVHIQANQLPHREKFDFNYQVKKSTETATKLDGVFLGSHCAAEKTSCTYLLQNLQPNEKYDIELQPTLYDEQVPFPLHGQLHTQNFLNGPQSDKVTATCEQIDNDVWLQCRLTTVVAERESRLVDRFDFDVKYTIFANQSDFQLDLDRTPRSAAQISDSVIQGIISGVNCSGAIGTCSFEFQVVLQAGDYVLNVDVTFGDGRSITLIFPFTAAETDDSKIDLTVIVGIAIAAFVLIVALLLLTAYCCFKNTRNQMHTTQTNMLESKHKKEPEYEFPNPKWQNQYHRDEANGYDKYIPEELRINTEYIGTNVYDEYIPEELRHNTEYVN